MPYEVRKTGRADKPYCVYKDSGGPALGCHASRGKAERQISAVLISEHASKSQKSVEVPSLRLALMITSNAYRDRVQEIVKQKALEDWAEAAWEGDTLAIANPLLFWHDGDPIGDIVYVGTEGAFLIEIAQERPDAMVNLMPPGSPPVIASIKGIWDAFEQMDIEWGASHEFLYLKEDGKDGVYEQIVKTESTVLPREWAANAYTLFTVL